MTIEGATFASFALEESLAGHLEIVRPFHRWLAEMDGPRVKADHDEAANPAGRPT